MKANLRICLRSLSHNLGFDATASGTDAAASKQVINPFNTNTMTPRRKQKKQVQAATTWKTFHDFQFTDQYEESGIRFEQRRWMTLPKIIWLSITIMGPASPWRMSMAMAADLFFVNQLGGNQLWRNLGQGKFENITATAGVGLTTRFVLRLRSRISTTTDCPIFM